MTVKTSLKLNGWTSTSKRRRRESHSSNACNDSKLHGPPAPAQKAPPEYTEITESDHHLAEMYREYCLHQQRVRALWEKKPRGTRMKEFDLARRYTIKEGQPLVWGDGTLICAVSGGCCGRDCGCCEKPLGSVLIPEYDGKVQRPFYGHCTAECGCCTESSGGGFISRICRWSGNQVREGR